MTTTVLVTGVGAPGTRGTLYSLRRNPDGKDVRIVGVDMDQYAVGRHWCERFFPVPAPEDDDYVPLMKTLCAVNSVDVILLQTTREAVRLSRDWRGPPPACVSPIVSMFDAVDKDKFLSTAPAAFRPRTQLVRSTTGLATAARAFGYPGRPFVVKPPLGDGSRGLRVVQASRSSDWAGFITKKPEPAAVTLEQLSSLLPATFPSLLAMEHLPGTEYSVDCFRGSTYEVAVPRARKRMVNGISFETTVELREDVTRACLEAAERLGLRYAFGFQMKLDAEGSPKFIECNPRVQGSMVASTLAGVNVVWMAVQEALGGTHGPVQAPKAVTLRRFWGGVGELPDGGAVDV